MAKCGQKCEVYSRVVGYYRPVQNWNHGKKSEFAERVEFQESCCVTSPVMAPQSGPSVTNTIEN